MSGRLLGFSSVTRMAAFEPQRARRVGAFEFEVVEVARGRAGLVGQRLSLFGQVARYSGRVLGPARATGPSIASTRLGGFFAMDYRLGALFLLFLRDVVGLLVAPLAPINEEVSGPDDPWLEWVRQQTREPSRSRRSPLDRPRVARGAE